jgi:hypothetical protein
MSRYDILLNDPKPETAAKPQGPAVNKPPDRPTKRSADDTTERPPDRASDRGELIRRGFEWYADQLRALKKLSLEDQMQGRSGSMSAMVRDALDEYLTKRRIAP